MTEPVRQDIQVIRDRIDRADRDLLAARKKHARIKAEFEQAEKELRDKVRFVVGVRPLGRACVRACVSPTLNAV